MTQNVKNRSSLGTIARGLAAVFWLSLGTTALISGCGADDSAEEEPSSGRYTPCQEASECDEAHGFGCVNGECSYECRTHADCAEVGHCDNVTVGQERRSFCVRDEEPPTPGELYTACPSGDECAEGAVCLGAGAGDLDAYCSVDCSTDRDCADGYYCGVVRRNPCEDACGVAGVPADSRCVPTDQIGELEKYRCSDLGGVEQSVCQKREFCSPCETDADCLAVPNQVCAKDGSGEKICTKLCDPNVRSCPWGNASECRTFDADLGVPTCGHRFGACHGKGEVCEPCRSDADCPGGACATSQFTGESWCINLNTQCACEKVDASLTCSDGGCPESPGGLDVLCIADESSTLFNTCYAANSATDGLLGSSLQIGCWGSR
ncbi:MAG: hypothetical protein K0R38_810 [Polyangiaceae bacterium]|nr:hypothetical protein [Polyangiaceae bacterium]